MKQIITISIIIALVFFTLGYLIGGTSITSIGQLSVKGDNTYQAGWDAAKQRLADSGFAPMIDNLEIKNLSGTVKEIKDKEIILKINPLEPLADPDLDERIVEIDDNTKIYVLEQKDQVQYQQEIDEFNKKMQDPSTSTEPIMPPDMYTKKEGNLSDIKVGAILNIIATDNDIKNAKEFKAAEISILSMPNPVDNLPEN